jgi:signal transduction histidine kinase
MRLSLRRIPLLWRIFFSTSIAIAALFAATGWVVQTYAARVSEQSLEREVRTSLQAYEALWTTRAQTLAVVSNVISSMSDVRAAFGTRDKATIRDTAQELWSRASPSRVAQEDAIFLVLSPTGAVIASPGGDQPNSWPAALPLEGIVKQFPRQVLGFLPQESRLYYVVLTPVYVQSGNGEELLNILLAGFEVNRKLADGLKQSTSGSEFAFLSGNHVVASTLPDAVSTDALQAIHQNAEAPGRVKLNGTDYFFLGSPLNDVEGRMIGELRILRSLGGASRALAELQRNVAIIWLLAVLAGLGLTYLLARRIIEPVRRLDHAASEVTRQNYDYRVPVETEDELGRLARTFNAMCDSLKSAREELIRHERMNTITRLSTSLVHDLRNPLAAIYGGAEMLVDSDLPTAQWKRLAASIYRASRRMHELLQDLSNISRGKNDSLEVCRLVDVVNAASDVVSSTAEAHHVRVVIDVPERIELSLGRARIERVFLNLMTNALEAMPHGGVLTISAKAENDSVLIEIDDTGAGVLEQAKLTLFQPFASVGKKNGLGLGLALSRQTLLDHGGDLWLGEKSGPGALFRMRLPESVYRPKAVDRVEVS